MGPTNMVTYTELDKMRVRKFSGKGDEWFDWKGEFQAFLSTKNLRPILLGVRAKEGPGSETGQSAGGAHEGQEASAG